MNRLFCLLLLPASASGSFAQGTIHIQFDGLPNGTMLGEQFAAQGVHFLQSGRYDAAYIVNDPGFPESPGGHVALFNQKPTVVGILFDQPISSFTVTAALSPTPPTGRLVLPMAGMDYPTTSTVIYQEPAFAASTWQTVSMGFGPATNIRLVELQGANIINDLNYGSPFFFTDINVTFVPEPSTAALVFAGLLPFAAWRLNRRKIFSLKSAEPA